MATTQVAVFSPAGNMPAFAKARGELSALTKSLAGGAGGFGKKISIKGGVFRLISDGKQVASIEERYLDVVIVAAAPKIARTYYEGEYSEENPAPPLCWSVDGNLPDPTSGTKQAASCATCPQNEKGSGKGDTRACRFSQRAAVVLANDVEGDVMQIQFAATSIFGKEEGESRPLQAYARWLAAQNVEANEVITRMKFDLSDAAFPKLFFKAMRWLTEDEHEVVVKQGATPDAQQAISMTVTRADKGADKPAAEEEPPAPPPKAKPKAKPPVDEDPPAPPPKAKAKPPVDEEPPAPEPSVRKNKPAAEPELPSSKISSLIEEWGADD